MEEAKELVEKTVETATDSFRVELEKARDENRNLKVRMVNMERALDKSEQYRRTYESASLRLILMSMRKIVIKNLVVDQTR